MAEWQQTRLGEISQIYSGFAFRSRDLGEAGIPIVKIGNIQNKRVSPECADHLPEELCIEKLNRYFLQQGDTLIAMTGAGSVGKVGKMPRVDGRFLVNQRVAIVRPEDSRCDPAFVYFVLSQDYYETKLYGLGLGAGQPNVSAKQIGELEIPFPPLPVQRRIAGILSAYDELMENSQRRIRLLEAMARALYRERFVHFRFPGHEKLPRVAFPLGDIPQGWEVKPLSQLCSRMESGGTPKRKTAEYWEGGDIDWFKTGERWGGFLFASEEKITGRGQRESNARLFEPGTIFMAICGSPTVGRLGIVTRPSSCNQAALGVVADREQISQTLLYFVLLSLRGHFKGLAQGAAQQNISKEKVASTVALVPPRSLVAPFDRRRADV
jgi:type I restriction enzyme S subunit